MERKTYKLRLSLNDAQLITSILYNNQAHKHTQDAYKQMKKQYLKRIKKATKDIDDEL